MKKSILFFLLLFFNYSFGQNQNSVWIFGDSAGIDFSNIIAPVPFVSTMDGRGSCVSIADSSGDLLFYAFTKAGSGDWSTTVNDKLHQTMNMPNTITGEAWYNELTIIPKPGTTNEYYLFSVGSDPLINQGLYYTVIDMNLNNGLGAIVQQNVQVTNTRVADCVQAVKHGNGRDWWVIAKVSNLPYTLFNRFLIYLISPSGITGPIIQDFNNASDGDFQKIIFNNKGNRIMQINFAGFMCEYDFDRCTGQISNPNLIYPELSSNYDRFFWEGAYSHNDSLFYVTSLWNNFTVSDTSRLLQYNLFASTIAASSDTIYLIKHPNVLGAVRLAPDEKIYVTNWYQYGFPGYPYPDSVYNQYNMNLSVVNNPNGLGQACNFQPFSFSLGGKRSYAGLPNNPNYSLSALTGSICDTLTTSIQETAEKIPVFYISPNPASNIAYFNAQHLRGKEGILTVSSLNGQLLYQKTLNDFNGGYATQRIDVSSFPNGMYFINLQTDKERVCGKMVVGH